MEIIRILMQHKDEEKLVVQRSQSFSWVINSLKLLSIPPVSHLLNQDHLPQQDNYKGHLANPAAAHDFR